MAGHRRKARRLAPAADTMSPVPPATSPLPPATPTTVTARMWRCGRTITACAVSVASASLGATLQPIVVKPATALPGLEEDQRREAGLRPHRLWRHGLHRPSHRRISGDVLSRRRCSVLGDRGTLDRQAPEGACRDR